MTEGKVLTGGVDKIDAPNCYFPPTIVRDAKFGEPLLTQEIFGPVLPIVRVDSIDEALGRVDEVCDKPLALYVFSEDKAVTNKVLDRTLSGGVCINSTIEQLSGQQLPFGGVGASGSGASHGKHGFDQFTHFR